MSRGLGKFERWILAATYAKTIQHQLPEGWKMPSGYATGERQWQLDVWDAHLSRAEILLNYFHLAIADRRKPHRVCDQCFETSPAYRTALTMLSRTLMGLYCKHLIEWDCVCFAGLTGLVQLDGFRLTSQGLDVAERLSVDSSWPGF